MKTARILAFIMALLLMLLVGCEKKIPLLVPGDETTPTPTASVDTTVEPTIQPTATPAPQKPAHLPEYPIIDGSSSTETMHAAIRGHLEDIHLSVTHSRTYDAFERLMPGAENPADMLLAVKYYDETLADAAERGADLVITPIAKEGFIFLLSKDNPIDSLTQQQIRDIYSGKITNWKELGGLDDEIVPFRRNETSGSQTAMLDFMRGVPFPDGPEDAQDIYISFSMSGLLGEISSTGTPAIGYNIYSWSMEQLLEWQNLKAITIDGIAPSNDTLADGTYPLIIYTYSYYNTGNEKARALTEWLLTDAGQDLITSVGYVGISGKLQSDDYSYWDLYTDDANSQQCAYSYYHTAGKDFLAYMLLEGTAAEPYANGLGRYLTIVWVCGGYFDWDYTTSKHIPPEEFRFITVTRDRGGEFEIINEGEFTDSAVIEKIIAEW